MIDIQKRIQRAAESILENEALTADLDDEAAQVLLDWGIARAQQIALATIEMDENAAEEAMYQPMRALRKMLRTTNKWVADPQQSTLIRIMRQAEIVYGSSPEEEQQAVFLAQIPETATERVRVLRAFIEGERQDSYEA